MPSTENCFFITVTDGYHVFISVGGEGGVGKKIRDIRLERPSLNFHNLTWKGWMVGFP